MSSPHILALGGTGSGKSAFVKHGILPEVTQKAYVAIFDVEDEYGPYSTTRVQEPEDALDALADGHHVVRYVPSYAHPRTEEAGEELDRFIQFNRAKQSSSPIVYVVDEAHEVQKPNKTYSDDLALLMRKGRKYGLAAMQISQDSSSVDTVTFRNSGRMYLFRMKDPNDKLNKFTDFNLSELESLPLYHYYRVSQNVGVPDKRCAPLDIG